MIDPQTAERIAKQREAAPSREDFLARFNDDGHNARLAFHDGEPPYLEIVCPHAGRLRGSLTSEQQNNLADAQCDDKMCWVREWHSDLTWEAMDVATWREDTDDRWPQWSPAGAVLRMLWRYEGYGDDAEFYFTLDDLIHNSASLRCIETMLGEPTSPGARCPVCG